MNRPTLMHEEPNIIANFRGELRVNSDRYWQFRNGTRFYRVRELSFALSKNE